MKRRVLLLSLVVWAAACGGGADSAAPAGAARAGRELFESRILGPNPGCITCHSLDPGTTLVGPSLAGVAGRAMGRVPGIEAGDYLRRSITDPGADVVDGFDDGIMPADWEEVLTRSDVDALVAFLLTLG